MFDQDASGGTTGPAIEGSQADLSPAAPTQDTSTPTGTSDATSPGSAAQPAASASTPSAAPAAPTLFDRIRELSQIDFKGKYKSEEELLNGLVNASRLVGQRNQHAEIGRYYEQHLADFQAYLQKQQAGVQQSPAAQQQPAKSWFAPPEWNDSWNAYLDHETGQPIESAPLDVRTAFSKRKEFYDRHRHDLVFNFPQAIKPALEEFKQSVIQDVEQRYASREQQVRLAAEADSLRDQNAHWIFENDGNGRFFTDELGRKILTPNGQLFVGYLGEAQRVGIQSQQHAVQYAILRTQQHLGLVGYAPPAATAQPPATAVRQPNSNAGRSPSGKKVEGNEGLSLADRLRRNLDEAGVTDEAMRKARLAKQAV